MLLGRKLKMLLINLYIMLIFKVLDVQVDDMPSDFDIAFSRFGVMFFEDPDQDFISEYRHMVENRVEQVLYVGKSI